MGTHWTMIVPATSDEYLVLDVSGGARGGLMVVILVVVVVKAGYFVIGGSSRGKMRGKVSCDLPHIGETIAPVVEGVAPVALVFPCRAGGGN